MTTLAARDDYAVMTESATLTMTRLLPGSIERVWAYLTESDLRRQWLASGEMEMRKGARFELVWRNSELTDPPGARPDGFGEEHRLDSEITELDPPYRLGFTWGDTGGVTLELEQVEDEVRLTVTHRRILDRWSQLNISAGWHAHLDMLAARLAGETPSEPFWDHWAGLKAQYERRIPA
jgi:uncharacterized protein YndB with AHSA1/START domain